MSWQRMVMEIGMGTDIRGADSTKAAVCALRDALWHNALTVTSALGMSADAMRVEVTVGVPRPETVDHDAVLAQLPHGSGSLTVIDGGLEIPHEDKDDSTLIAHAAAVVYLDLPETP